jgi:hypothetical protein
MYASFHSGSSLVACQTFFTPIVPIRFVAQDVMPEVHRMSRVSSTILRLGIVACLRNPVKRQRYEFLRAASVTGRDPVGEKFSPQEGEPVYTVMQVFFCRIIFPPPNQRRNPKIEA